MSDPVKLTAPVSYPFQISTASLADSELVIIQGCTYLNVAGIEGVDLQWEIRPGFGAGRTRSAPLPVPAANADNGGILQHMTFREPCTVAIRAARRTGTGTVNCSIVAS